MTTKIVLALSGRGANDAINGMITDYSDAIAAVGLSVVQISLEPAELQYAMGQINGGNVAFGLTWLGIGQDLSVNVDGRQTNLWEASRTPLLKLHGDHPAYFAARHSDTPRNSVNFYVASEFIAYRRKWLREARALTALLPPMPLAPLEKAEVTSKSRRNGKLVFLKNGNDPKQLRTAWQERLPHAVTNLLDELTEQITPVGLKRGPLQIADFVAASLERRGIDPDSARYFIPFFTAQMDDYLRRVKSTMIARSLLDLPIIVQGSNWEHVDFAGRRAQLLPGQDFDHSKRIFIDQLGVIDMSPNLDSGPHERVMRAAGNYSLVLTNHQTWVGESLAGFDDLMFDFNPDSIAARASDVIAHRDRYLELALSFGDAFRARYPRERVGNAMVDMAELAVLQWSPEKPSIQPFFIW